MLWHSLESQSAILGLTHGFSQSDENSLLFLVLIEWISMHAPADQNMWYEEEDKHNLLLLPNTFIPL